MKKIIIALTVLAVISCKKEETKPVNYTLFTGQITNPNSNKLTIYKGQKNVKEITVDKDGKFADTLRLKNGQYVIYDGTEQASIYVTKGKHFNLTLDTNNFDETLKFTGEGAEANSYFAKQTMLQEGLDLNTLINSNKEVFDSKLKTYRTQYLDLLKNAKGLDSLTIVEQTNGIESIITDLIAIRTENEKMNKMVGKPSATFNFDNHKGGKTSLASLKGKYVYIDLWATWCGPCKKEIPFLQKIEEEYHGKNIAFVSISVDQNKDAWTKMVTDKKLGGIQLHYGGDRNFTDAYTVNTIPRFILLDPKGNIVKPNAPAPSTKELKELLVELGI